MYVPSSAKKPFLLVFSLSALVMLYISSVVNENIIYSGVFSLKNNTQGFSTIEFSQRNKLHDKKERQKNKYLINSISLNMDLNNVYKYIHILSTCTIAWINLAGKVFHMNRSNIIIIDTINHALSQNSLLCDLFTRRHHIDNFIWCYLCLGKCDFGL